MTGLLSQRLAAGKPLLLDGAMGTELDRRGVRTYLPLWSAVGLIERPEVVRDIHRDYALAGADILTTNTFRTTGRTMRHAGRDPAEAAALNRLAFELARMAAVEASSDALVAGSIAPLEDCYSPHLSPLPEIALAEHREQAKLLAEAGADCLMVETMPLIAEAVAAVQAATETGLDVTVGLVLNVDGKLMSGESLEEAVRAIEPMHPAAIFVNCSPPGVISRALGELSDLTRIPVGGYANLGVVEETVGWASDESVTGSRYAEHAKTWLEAGATIVGGCCGTRPEHIAGLRELLDRELVTTS